MGGGTDHQLDTAMIALGYIGGAGLSICLVPQLIVMWKTKSAGDLSLPWLILYSFGLVLSAVYLVYIEAMAAWIPMIAELSLTLLTLALKLYLDAAYPSAVPQSDAREQQEPSVGRSIHRTESMGSAAPPSAPRIYGRAVSRRAVDYLSEMAHSSSCPHCKKSLNVKMKQSASGRWSRAAVEAGASSPTESVVILRDPDATV